MEIKIASEPEPLILDLPTALRNHYALSPYVVRAPDGYAMLVRLVNRSDDPSRKVSVIHAGRSADGITFIVDPEPAIAPGRAGADDDLGCEDPTIVTGAERCHVFYSGYGGPQKSSSMLWATGTALTDLAKRGKAFDGEKYSNPKEAALVSTPSGNRMFFEYATGGASRIGVASSVSLDGPWKFADSPIAARAGKFDAWHLSPGSVVDLANGKRLLFYNGATRKTDWRIGWVLLAGDGLSVEDRSELPLVGTFGLEPGDSDIAFVASAVVGSRDEVSLYYSISDRRLLRLRVDVEGAQT